MLNIAEVSERFRQDRAERHLYGASVVDAYQDLAAIRQWIQRRRPQADIDSRLIYGVLATADRGGLRG